MIAFFLSNISAKYYKNPSMLSPVIAKNVGDVFLRHSVEVRTTKSVTSMHSGVMAMANTLIVIASTTATSATRFYSICYH